MTIFRRSRLPSPPAAEEMPPRPPQCREPAEQRTEWWGGRGIREQGFDPCGSGPLETGSDESNGGRA